MGYPLSLIFSTIKKRLYKKFDLFNRADDFIIDKQLTKKRSIIKKFSVYHLFLIFPQKSVCS